MKYKRIIPLGTLNLFVCSLWNVSANCEISIIIRIKLFFSLCVVLFYVIKLTYYPVKGYLHKSCFFGNV